MAAFVNVNGRITPDREAVVSVFDHGFLFGEGVYETLRTYHRRPFMFDRHLKRLRASSSMIDLTVPLSDEEISARVKDTAEQLKDAPELYIRILLTRGVGEFTYDPTACPEPTLVIVIKPHIDPPADAFENGVRISLVSIIRNHPGSVNPLIKSNNLLNNALAMQEAIRCGGYEALMRNYRGELAECSQSNFFIVKDGEVLTPPLSAGLLAGVTRDFVFELGQDIGVTVREAALFDDDLFGADEGFLTSTTREVLPFTRVDEHVIGGGRPGPISKRLLEAFRARAWAS